AMQPYGYPQYPAQAAPQPYAQYPSIYPGYPGAPIAPMLMPNGPAAPAAPAIPGTLDGFYGQQSSGGGPAFKVKAPDGSPQINKSYVGMVERTPGDADIRQATNSAGVPQTFKNGSPKWIMVVPMIVQQGPEFPEGRAGWWVKGQARDELARAMAEAGAPAGPPEAGAGIRVTLVGTRPVPGMNPAYQYRVEYMRPNSTAAVIPPPAPAVHHPLP